jgi:hypothetical protein
MRESPLLSLVKKDDSLVSLWYMMMHGCFLPFPWFRPCSCGERKTPVAGGPDVCAGSPPGRSGAAPWGLAPIGQPLACPVEGAGPRRTAFDRPRGSSLGARRPAEAASGPGVDPRSASPRLENRPVDAAAHRPIDPAALRGFVPSRPRLASGSRLGLHAPETRTPGPRTRRAGRRAVVAPPLARHKKNSGG